MTEKKKSLLISVLFIALGALIFLQASGIKMLMKNDVGSGFFPKVVGVCIIAVAVVKLIMSLNMKNAAAKPSAGDMKGGWTTIALMAVYVALFAEAGFLTSTAVYLFLQMLILCPEDIIKKNLPIFAIISIAAPVAIYWLFVYAINMPLPKGLFGF